MPWNGMETYHGADHRVDGKPSCFSRYACHHNKAKCAESTEMTMHEKATRGGILRELKLQPRKHKTQELRSMRHLVCRARQEQAASMHMHHGCPIDLMLANSIGYPSGPLRPGV